MTRRSSWRGSCVGRDRVAAGSDARTEMAAKRPSGQSANQPTGRLAHRLTGPPTDRPNVRSAYQLTLQTSVQQVDQLPGRLADQLTGRPADRPPATL